MEEINLQEWVSASNAAKIADVSLSWIRSLGLRGRFRTVDTELGKLYYKKDVENYERERHRRKPALAGDGHDDQN